MLDNDGKKQERGEGYIFNENVSTIRGGRQETGRCYIPFNLKTTVRKVRSVCASEEEQWNKCAA